MPQTIVPQMTAPAWNRAGRLTAPPFATRPQSDLRRKLMNYLATTALILSFGIPGYAQHISANMRLSGTAAASAVDLGTGAPVSEYTLAGKGALGKFTLRVVSSGTTSQQQSTTCTGPNKLYFPILTGAAVFR